MLSFQRTKEELAKNAQISLKSSKVAVFRLLVNKYTIEIKRNSANRKLLTREGENDNRPGKTSYKWPPHTTTPS